MSTCKCAFRMSTAPGLCYPEERTVFLTLACVKVCRWLPAQEDAIAFLRLFVIASRLL